MTTEQTGQQPAEQATHDSGLDLITDELGGRIIRYIPNPPDTPPATADQEDT